MPGSGQTKQNNNLQSGGALVALSFLYPETFETGLIAGVCLLFYGITGFLHLASVILHQGTWLNEVKPQKHKCSCGAEDF